MYDQWLNLKTNYSIPYINKRFRFNNIEDCNILTDFIINRINTSSDLYQMFDYIGDIFYYNIDNKEIYYYMNIPINMHKPSIIKNTIYFEITLQYGDKITNINSIGRKMSTIGSESKSILLHPVIKIFQSLPFQLLDIVHLDEDLFSEFIYIEKYHNKIYRLLKSYM